MKSAYIKTFSLAVLTILLASCHKQIPDNVELVKYRFPKNPPEDIFRNKNLKKVKKSIKIGENVYKIYADCQSEKLLSVEYKNRNILKQAALNNEKIVQLLKKTCNNQQSEKILKIGEKHYKVSANCQTKKLIRVEYKYQNLLPKIAANKNAVRQLMEMVCTNP